MQEVIHQPQTSRVRRKPDAMYGITDQGICWVASLLRRRKRLMKSFAFSMYGDREAALRAAQAWRDNLMREHPMMLKRDKASRINSNNTTGYPGVFCIKRPDGSVQSWRAQTRVGNGRVICKSFSLQRYGKHAKAMAIAERQRQLEKMEGPIRPTPATPPPITVPAPVISRERVMRKDNRTGIPGVCLSRDPDGTPRAWMAVTQIAPGHRLLNEFTVLEHGEERARQLAIEERERQLKLKRKLAGQLSENPMVKRRSLRHTDPMYGIHEQGAQWLVHLKRSGILHVNVFAFKTQEAKASSLVRAQAWRNAVVAKYPLSLRPRTEVAQKVKANNTSGVSGVKCGKNKYGEPSRWTAHTRIGPGMSLCKSFNIAKYGYDGAKAMAIAERARQLEQMERQAASRSPDRNRRQTLSRLQGVSGERG